MNEERAALLAQFSAPPAVRHVEREKGRYESASTLKLNQCYKLLLDNKFSISVLRSIVCV
jgi:hypothetical protein